MVWARSVNFRSLLALLVGARAIIRRAILISTCKERERERAPFRSMDPVRSLLLSTASLPARRPSIL
uniref:Putative secreted protein n=1 Tax=Anopheles darlingi TaxID=43151 RepID=A0A2M4D1R5_ANODA